jgi:hypothetical protein
LCGGATRVKKPEVRRIILLLVVVLCCWRVTTSRTLAFTVTRGGYPLPTAPSISAENVQRAHYLNPLTGRFWTMDTYEGSQSDPLSLHKYLYCHDNPVDMVDPSGQDVYKLVLYSKDDPFFGLLHHRVIIGDDGYGGSYRFEKGGNGLSPVRTAVLSYISYTNVPAIRSVAIETGGATLSNPKAYGGYIDKCVKTGQAVDLTLSESARSLNGKQVKFIFLWNDCGTCANEWLVTSEEKERYAAYPYFPASTGRLNYVSNVPVDGLFGM